MRQRPAEKSRCREEARILQGPESKPETLLSLRINELTLAATVGAIYILSTVIPVSVFIGGSGLITLAIVVSPLIAALLRPVPAAIAATIGGLGMALAQTAFFPAFQGPAILVPMVAITAGSIAFHYKWGAVVPWFIVLFGTVFYLAYSQGTLFFLGPYTLVLVSLPLLFRTDLSDTYRIGLLTLQTAMVEQVMLNVESVLIVGLTGPIWAVITPFMYFERTVAVVGGTVAILALKNRFGPSLFQTSHQVEVSR